MRMHAFGSVPSLVAGVALGALGTYVVMSSGARDRASAAFMPAEATAAPAPDAQQAAAQTTLIETTLQDVLGRVVALREFERAPGTGGTPHRHPGSHTFGYVLEGTYEVQVNDGPVRRLGPGEVFYEPPGALHAVSRNGSATDAVRYLVITISDPTLPATVQEPPAQ